MTAKPDYVYVASSWRNPFHAEVCATLFAAGIDHYDFKNPPDGTGFSWREVKPGDEPSSTMCANCSQEIALSTFKALGFWEPDWSPGDDPEIWRHKRHGYAACNFGSDFATPAVKLKNTDWEPVSEYLTMVHHPRATEGFDSDFGAMQKADTFVLVLPCGKSAHLELGWAVGAGKRTAILLEDPVEPELMYRMVDYLAPSLDALVDWLTP